MSPPGSVARSQKKEVLDRLGVITGLSDRMITLELPLTPLVGDFDVGQQIGPRPLSRGVMNEKMV